jgi:nitronate monooxygenase
VVRDSVGPSVSLDPDVNLRTPLCDLLGVEVPILSVGFGDSAVPELAAAVSNAGGCGVVGLTVPLGELELRVQRTRELTDRPFGGNIIIAALASADATEERRQLRRQQIAAAFANHIPVLVLFWGDAAPFVEQAHRSGTKLLLQVGDADEARTAARAGVDAIIVQGIEAGGHVKATRSIWAVLPEAVEAARPTPIIASGGIGDGRGIARALRLGAQGVSLGTRFVASREAWIHEHYKQRVVDARAADTVLTPDLYHIGWPDAPHRSLKNKTYRAWVAAGQPPIGKRPGEGEVIGTQHLPWGDAKWLRYGAGMLAPTFDGDPEDAVMWAGESVDQVTSVKPAGEIVRQLAREAAAELAAT